VQKEDGQPGELVAGKTAKAYLTYQLYFLRYGVKALVAHLSATLRARLENVDIKAKVTLAQVENIFKFAFADIGVAK